MSITEEQRGHGPEAAAQLLREAPVTPWRVSGDPFADAVPLTDLSPLTGGLPDPRDAEEILRDLARGRAKRSRR